MNRFKCPACGRNQYTSTDTAEGCIYCVYKGPLELMDPAGVEKTGEEVDEQLIKLLQSDKEELKRWIKRMKYHCNKVNELRIELNKYQKLLKRIESSPKMPIERWTGDEREIICPACKSYICYPEDIKTIDLKYRQFCGACGQKLNWESEVEEG
jgi:transcription elongation factor Elf1